MSAVAASPVSALTAAQMKIERSDELIQDAIELAHAEAKLQRATSQHRSEQEGVDAFWQALSAALVANTRDRVQSARALHQLQRTFARISVHLAYELSAEACE